MRRLKVGSATINGTRTDVYLIPGATAWGRLDDGRVAIHLGADATYGYVAASMVHEAMEMAAVLLDLRWTLADRERREVFFAWTHDQFDHVCASAGTLVTPMFPLLAKAYKAWHGRKKAGK